MASITNTLTQPVLLAFFANLCRRWPITTAAIGIVVVVSIYDHFPTSAAAGSVTLRPSVAVQYVPPTTLKQLPKARTVTVRARNSKALSGFRRVRVGENEVDYIAEDVTIRIFTHTPPPAQAPRVIRQFNIGEDVTVRYFAHKPELALQKRTDSAAGQSTERSSPISK